MLQNNAKLNFLDVVSIFGSEKTTMTKKKYTNFFWFWSHKKNLSGAFYSSLLFEHSTV